MAVNKLRVEEQPSLLLQVKHQGPPTAFEPRDEARTLTSVESMPLWQVSRKHRAGGVHGYVGKASPSDTLDLYLTAGLQGTPVPTAAVIHTCTVTPGHWEQPAS